VARVFRHAVVTGRAERDPMADLKGALAPVNVDPEWRIPAPRMKMKRPHIVPLARQVVALFVEVQKHTAGGKFVFPTSHDLTQS
jgi:integrase